MHKLSISQDGYAAGPGQDAEHPLGVGGERLHEWVLATPTGRALLGEPQPGGVPGIDDEFHARGEQRIGATTSTVVTDGIEAALEQACAAAGDTDVRLGGGAAAVRQYLRAGLVDELHVAVVPVLLGSGERLFEGPASAGLECVEFVGSAAVAHVRSALTAGG